MGGYFTVWPEAHRDVNTPMQCYYCGVHLRGRFDYQLDHWPVPRRFGGYSVVRACVRCHDYKDRMSHEEFTAEHKDACYRVSLPHLYLYSGWIEMYPMVESFDHVLASLAMHHWELWDFMFRLNAARLVEDMALPGWHTGMLPRWATEIAEGSYEKRFEDKCAASIKHWMGERKSRRARKYLSDGLYAKDRARMAAAFVDSAYRYGDRGY